MLLFLKKKVHQENIFALGLINYKTFNTIIIISLIQNSHESRLKPVTIDYKFHFKVLMRTFIYFQVHRPPIKQFKTLGNDRSFNFYFKITFTFLLIINVGCLNALVKNIINVFTSHQK